MKTALMSNEPGSLVYTTLLDTPVNLMIREVPPDATLSVTILGSEYLVDYGSGVGRRFHRVNKYKECACGDPHCPAIDAVRAYLRAGGARAPDPERMPPCPICGSRTTRDRNWDGKYTHELGWRCEVGGIRHFLQAKAERIKQNIAAHPWLIPPAPGYPGLRREDVMTWEECAEINRRKFLETGYDPTR